MSDSFQKIVGGCYCGEIRYEILSAPEQSLVCHCPDCRRVTGAQAVAYLLLPQAAFVITAGQPVEFNSSAGATRSFCGKCGTTLSWVGDKQPGRIDITIGSLDNPEQYPPTRAVYRRHKLSWASEI